jgi:hypothetical protein
MLLVAPVVEAMPILGNPMDKKATKQPIVTGELGLSTLLNIQTALFPIISPSFTLSRYF